MGEAVFFDPRALLATGRRAATADRARISFIGRWPRRIWNARRCSAGGRKDGRATFQRRRLLAFAGNQLRRCTASSWSPVMVEPLEQSVNSSSNLASSRQTTRHERSRYIWLQTTLPQNSTSTRCIASIIHPFLLIVLMRQSYDLSSKSAINKPNLNIGVHSSFLRSGNIIRYPVRVCPNIGQRWLNLGKYLADGCYRAQHTWIVLGIYLEMLMFDPTRRRATTRSCAEEAQGGDEAQDEQTRPKQPFCPCDSARIAGIN